MEILNDRRCQFVIPRKNRTCRMFVKEGKKYCGEHASADPNETERIPCPLDRNHTVNAKELDEHLVKCNSRLRLDLKWIVENVNGIKPIDHGTQRPKINLKQISDVRREEIVQKVERTYEEISKFFVEDYQNHSVFDSTLKSEEFGDEQRKHFVQQASIIGHLEKASMLKNDICFVEFGAGRAKLAYWLSKCVSEKGFEDCRCLLVERSGQRYKFENKSTHEGTDRVEFSRIRCSIEHVDLRRYPWLVDKNQPLVAVCKHLCGSGTDAALRSIVNSRKSSDTYKKLEIIGAAMAPCCHHRCTWNEFVGREFFLEFGFDEDEFWLITQMSSWATCGISLQIKNEAKSSAFPNIDREKVGRKCKALLDYCRAKFLEFERFRVQLIYFVPVDVTPENLLFILSNESEKLNDE